LERLKRPQVELLGMRDCRRRIIISRGGEETGFRPPSEGANLPEPMKWGEGVDSPSKDGKKKKNLKSNSFQGRPLKYAKQHGRVLHVETDRFVLYFLRTKREKKKKWTSGYLTSERGEGSGGAIPCRTDRRICSCRRKGKK